MSTKIESPSIGKQFDTTPKACARQKDYLSRQGINGLSFMIGME